MRSFRKFVPALTGKDRPDLTIDIEMIIEKIEEIKEEMENNRTIAKEYFRKTLGQPKPSDLIDLSNHDTAINSLLKVLKGNYLAIFLAGDSLVINNAPHTKVKFSDIQKFYQFLDKKNEVLKKFCEQIEVSQDLLSEQSQQKRDAINKRKI